MSADLKPVLGFVVTCYWANGHLVPEILINPLDVARVFDEGYHRNELNAVVYLKDGTKLRLYKDSMATFSEKLNKAMQERLAVEK